MRVRVAVRLWGIAQVTTGWISSNGHGWCWWADRPIECVTVGAKLGAIRWELLWTPMGKEACHSGPGGWLWSVLDTAWTSTDQKVGGSSPSGRAGRSFCVSRVVSVSDRVVQGLPTLAGRSAHRHGRSRLGGG